jgi:hypothetical protein
MEPLAPEYLGFFVPATISLIGCIIGTLVTKPTDADVLSNFYAVTKPFGFWGPMRAKMDPLVRLDIRKENRADILSTFIAVPWQALFFMTGMLLIMKSWNNFFISLSVFIALSVGLYFFWFRKLSATDRS